MSSAITAPLAVPSGSEVVDQTEVEAGATERYDGMRREWNFTVSLRHKAAAAHLQLIPMWKSVFVDAELACPQLLAATQHASAGVTASKRAAPPPVPIGTMIPWYGYEDASSAIKAVEEEGAGGGGTSSSPQRAGTTTANAVDEFGMGEQLNKTVRMYYCPLPSYLPTEASLKASRSGGGAPQTDAQRHREALEAFCKQSVQYVLQSDDHVVSIDGETDLQKLCLGNKLHCKERLGGAKSFSFRYTIIDRKNMRHVHGYAIGTVAQGPPATHTTTSSHDGYFPGGGVTTAAALRANAVEKVDSSTLPCIGYLTTVACSHQEELNVYIQTGFVRHFCVPSKFQVGRHDIVYKPCTYNVLAEQQLLFGEMEYFDRDAALSFTLPMHPMHLRPDFSPIQTVGVGSVACMTSEIMVYQKLCDDNLEDDILGGGQSNNNDRINSITSLGSNSDGRPNGNNDASSLPKHKSNPVTLFLDVERVVKMGYPAVMSISQYAQLKAERLQTIFRNVTTVGEPLHIDLGPRPGRSTTVTFNYEGGSRNHANGSVKAMLVSTLVGNLGVTAVYFTPLGHGLFDAHLYLFQHLLRNITFFGERQLRSKFSRFTTQNFRLTEQDISRVYSSAPQGERGAIDQHIKALQASTDGKVDSAKATFMVNPRTLVAVPVSGFTATNAAVPLATNNNGDAATATTDEEAAAAAVSAGGVAHGDSAVFDSRPIPVLNVPRLAMASQQLGDDEDGKDTQSPSPDHFHHDTTAGSPTTANHNDGDGESGASLTMHPQGDADTTTAVTGTPAFNSLKANAATVEVDISMGREGSENTNTGEDDDDIAELIGTGDSNPDGTVGGALMSPEAAQEAADRELVNNILANDDTNTYFGPSLRDVYVRCCETCGGCRPNSYLYNKLPLNSRFTNSVEELDLTSNYVGHQGFQAILNFIEYLPRLKILIFDDMGLDNTDVKNLVETILDRPQSGNHQHVVTTGAMGLGSQDALPHHSNNNNTTTSPNAGGTVSANANANHHCLTRISLCNNAKITLPATKHLTRLIRLQKSIYTLQLSGTSLGDSLAKRIEQEALQNAPVGLNTALADPDARVSVESHPYQRDN